VREREAAGLPAPHASHRRVQPAIPQNEFLEAPLLRISKAAKLKLKKERL